jgi:hypothetical protein
MARLRRREVEAAAHDEEGASERAAARERLLDAAGTGAAGSALVQALALHLGVPGAAVIAPDLARRLTEWGLEPDLAADAARAVEADVASRYAGPSGSTTGAVSPDLARRLAEALAVRDA